MDSVVLQVVLALAFPILWGVVTAWAYDRVTARRRRRGNNEPQAGEETSQ